MKYISIKTKFRITILTVILWTILCSIIEIPWYCFLIQHLPKLLVIMIILCLAFFPGIMISLVICGIILDQPRIRDKKNLQPITILIAAYNEEETIYNTVRSIAAQQYNEKIIVNIIDNNSKDNTKKEIERSITDFSSNKLQINYLYEKQQGKFAALNNGLQKTLTEFVITLDADTFLYKDSLAILVDAMAVESKNKSVGAIAGTVLVRNSRVNILTKMQEWEYFLSISSIKRMQGLFQSTLVAQGAFSIYNTDELKQIGGWKDSIGEDIVLTWQLLSRGNAVYYEQSAIAFTNVPVSFKIFFRQRARWARGMIEGFKYFSFKECKNKYSNIFVFCDYFLFAIDFGICAFFIPGIILAVLFKLYWIVGIMTLILFPLTLLLFGIMFACEYKRVFKPLKLRVRKHYLGLLCFMLTYSLLLSPACISGYLQEFFGKKRKWK